MCGSCSRDYRIAPIDTGSSSRRLGGRAAWWRNCRDRSGASVPRFHSIEFDASSMLLRQCCDDTLAFFFDVLGEARVALLHKTCSQTQLEERYRECRRQIVEIGTDLGQLECFYGF